VKKGPIVEAFPNAFLGVCLDDDVFGAMPSLRRGKKFDWLYEQWSSKGMVHKLPGLTTKERALFQAEFDKTVHHEHRAALVCVLTGLLTAHGHFTAIWLAAGYTTGPGVNELPLAGGILSEGLRTVRCETIDIDVPAEAEIVLEGEILPGDYLEPEGPFARTPMRLKKISFRRKLIVA
jgi:3-octaprenyl-4-hydroxybenzoate carboxy-lyase